MRMNVADAITAMARTLRPGRSVVLRTPSRAIRVLPPEGGSHETLEVALSRHVRKHRQAIRVAAPAPKKAPAGAIALSRAAAIKPKPSTANITAANGASRPLRRSPLPPFAFAPSELRWDKSALRRDCRPA